MEKSMKPILDEFGDLLMRQVRDEAFGAVQRIISKGGRIDHETKKFLAQVSKSNPEYTALLGGLLALSADAGIAHFLNFLDAYNIELFFRAADGNKYDIRAISDGLAGELYTEDGWIDRFSDFQNHILPIK